MSEKKVKTRIAPSPTGSLHLGTVRTALYNMLFAKHHGGDFLFRLEDTDIERSKEEHTQEIIDGFNWLGIKWDKPSRNTVASFSDKDAVTSSGLELHGACDETGIVRQGVRAEIHQKYIDQLLQEGKAYKCFVTREELDAMKAKQRAAKKQEGYDNRHRDLSDEETKAFEAEGRDYVIRLNLDKAIAKTATGAVDGDANNALVEVPQGSGQIEWQDAIRGAMSINVKDLGGDLVIQKSTGQVLYNFAVVIDDHEMGISHVFRGEDHLTNTAKQIAIYCALGFQIPEFGHLPLIFTVDKQKLSKRKHGDIAGIEKYQREGYLPEALVNYLIATSYTLPINHHDEKLKESPEEVYTMEDVRLDFDIRGVSKSPAIYDIKKLNWYNSEYIKTLDHGSLMKYLKPFLAYDLSVLVENEQKELVEGIRGNLNKFDEINENLCYFFDDIEIPDDLSKFIEKGQVAIKTLVERFEEINFTDLPSTQNTSKELINNIGKEHELKGKNLFWPIRIAVSGQSHGPDLGLVFYFIGKDKVKQRLESAIGSLIK